jgi:cbb3-type cytochrome oxidase subunit 3
MQSFESKLLGVLWLSIIYGIGYAIFYRIKAKKAIQKAADEYAMTKHAKTQNQATTGLDTSSQNAYHIVGSETKLANTESTGNQNQQIGAATSLLQMENLEDWAYEQVGKELDSNNLDIGAWTKAFAQANGDDKQTRVIYIKARVEKLIAVGQAERESAVKTENAEKAEKLPPPPIDAELQKISKVSNFETQEMLRQKPVPTIAYAIFFLVLLILIFFAFPESKKDQTPASKITNIPTTNFYDRVPSNQAIEFVNLGWKNMVAYSPDFALAMHYNQLGYESNHPEGAANIGLLYENGWGVKKNATTAATWYQKAIDLGSYSSAQANFQLAGLYEKGLGVNQDLNTAKKHYSMALNISTNSAHKFYLDEKAAKLSRDAINRLSGTK